MQKYLVIFFIFIFVILSFGFTPIHDKVENKQIILHKAQNDLQKTLKNLQKAQQKTLKNLQEVQQEELSIQILLLQMEIAGLCCFIEETVNSLLQTPNLDCCIKASLYEDAYNVLRIRHKITLKLRELDVPCVECN